MKLLRISGLIIFLLSAVAFTFFQIYKASSSDTSGPVFACKEEYINTSVNTTKEELLKGVTAFDKRDKDVTDTVMIEKLSSFINTGKRKISYTAYDSSNNVTKWERELEYTDYTPPRFSLTKPLIFAVGDQENIIRYMSVFDCIDGNLSDKIRYEEPEDDFGETEGAYQLKFIVTNSAGDTAYLPATVEFHYEDYDNKEKIPQIILSNYLIYLQTETSFDSKSFLSGVKIDNKQYSILQNQQGSPSGLTISQDKIGVRSEVNMHEPGTYEVVYSMKTEEGYIGTTKLLVVVENRS
jgi:hypothetical protein